MTASPSHPALPAFAVFAGFLAAFPRNDRSPMMVPHQMAQIAKSTSGQIRDIDRVASGFYISQALEFRP